MQTKFLVVMLLGALVGCSSASSNPEPSTGAGSTSSDAPTQPATSPESGNEPTAPPPQTKPSLDVVGPSGLVSAQPLIALNNQEMVRFCDWMIELRGGEKIKTKCSDGTFRLSKTKAECMDGFDVMKSIAACIQPTVGQMETCAIEVDTDPCAAGSSQCTSLRAKIETCMGKD